MYLSKILIRGTACRNPYEIHRVLWKLFPENADATRDFLFRVERLNREHAEVLMQSGRQPVLSTHAAQILASKEYPLSLQTGQRLRFRLVANPVKTIYDEQGRTRYDGKPKKCRVPLIREEEQRDWLLRKFQSAASHDVLNIDTSLPLRFKKRRENRVGKIQPVIFQGILRVNDTTAVMNLIKKGIGPAKAFGCGLLSLARI